LVLINKNLILRYFQKSTRKGFVEVLVSKNVTGYRSENNFRSK